MLHTKIPTAAGHVAGRCNRKPVLCVNAVSRTSSSAVSDADTSKAPGMVLNRRDAMALLLASQLAINSPALAVQGLTAGRIPGLASTPDENGFLEYSRPEGKSGGHGVGWSEIPRYSFKVPDASGWAEIPVSIADLGGTEIDLRYSSKEQGEVAVVVAPVARFSDIGFNANVRIEELGTPTKIIQGFGPELFGKPVDEEDILDVSVTSHGGLTYYNFELKPHNLVSATAVRNRMFILSIRANPRQWKKHSADLLAIRNSFNVPFEVVKTI